MGLVCSELICYREEPMLRGIGSLFLLGGYMVDIFIMDFNLVVILICSINDKFFLIHI